LLGQIGDPTLLRATAVRYRATDVRIRYNGGWGPIVSNVSKAGSTSDM